MTARELAFIILTEVLKENAYANIALRNCLNKYNLDERDGALCTEIVYGVLRRKNYLEWIINSFSKKPLKKLDPPIYIILLMGLYQLVYLTKIPDSAAVNESVELAKKYSHSGGAKFVNALLRNYLRNKDNLKLPDRNRHKTRHLALLYQQPEWFISFGLRNWGDEKTEALCRFYSENHMQTLRVNTIMSTLSEIKTAFEKEGVSVQETLLPEALSYEGNISHRIGKYLAQGCIYIQDIASMWVAHAVAPKKGEKILDICAAPGGKSTHLAALMENEGVIIAGDIYTHKIKLIEANAKRLKAKIVRPVLQDATQYRPEWEQYFDRVLVDAPCSGLGVLGKRPDMKWRREEASLVEFPILQKAILAQAKRYIRPGGYLVYSTCTLNPLENQLLVEKFLDNNTNFKPVLFKLPGIGEVDGQITIWPPKYQTDGFYISVLQRTV